MGSSYDLKYLPPKPGDEWKPETLVSSMGRIREFRGLNPQSGKGLERIANEYIAPEILSLGSEEEISKVVNSYSGMIDSSVGSYVINNLNKALGYVDQRALLPIALNLPVKKRKAKDGEELSDKDKKYNDVADSILRLKRISEARKSKEGLVKEIEAELEGADERSKEFWLKTLGAEAIYEHRQMKSHNVSIKKVIDYGLAPYFSDALKLSDSSERDFAEKKKKLDSKMQEEFNALASRAGLPPTPKEIGLIRDKYAPEFEKLKGEFAGYTNARQLILEGHGEEMPGLISLVEFKYLQDKKKKEEEAKKAEKKQ